ncbi:AraC family transcriptional regulator [uncultured Bacteroides sp.]|uniref:helix-turn-helix domain-containing protein n=1 Tax=uncultured Bacteroides sp. TaxID=162156 RepID=UPI002AA6DC26|nr:AraC family transcriptional regulator [uncultured Bacteroides sp.]
MTILKEYKKPQILYSCYFTRSKEGENFVPEHIFSYQVSGELTVNDGVQTYRFREGDFRFSRRNCLSKFMKEPPEGGQFKSISLFLDQAILKEIANEMNYKAGRVTRNESVVSLDPHPLYKSFMESLIVYLDLKQEHNEELFTFKIKEAIYLLLKVNPELKDVLFDFSEPGKIDLEAYMNQNFYFNVHLNRFAYLTGRSLATFKRDFQKIFNDTPSHWLQQKRLQEAYYLIKEKGKVPSDVYLEVGFENLSHFSTSFKRLFGYPPSKLSVNL